MAQNDTPFEGNSFNAPDQYTPGTAHRQFSFVLDILVISARWKLLTRRWEPLPTDEISREQLMGLDDAVFSPKSFPHANACVTFGIVDKPNIQAYKNVHDNSPSYHGRILTSMDAWAVGNYDLSWVGLVHESVSTAPGVCGFNIPLNAVDSWMDIANSPVITHRFGARSSMTRNRSANLDFPLGTGYDLNYGTIKRIPTPISAYDSNNTLNYRAIPIDHRTMRSTRGGGVFNMTLDWAGDISEFSGAVNTYTNPPSIVFPGQIATLAVSVEIAEGPTYSGAAQSVFPEAYLLSPAGWYFNDRSAQGFVDVHFQTPLVGTLKYWSTDINQLGSRGVAVISPGSMKQGDSFLRSSFSSYMSDINNDTSSPLENETFSLVTNSYTGSPISYSNTGLGLFAAMANEFAYACGT